SLEPGKLADVIAVDLSGPETQPLHNPLSQLVYACNGSQVSHSWIGGELVMRERHLTRIDIDQLAHRTQAWQARIANTRGAST
ncbi:MAG: TRZ/ATZ family hydrolase, partial [Halioglobus sp.]|nr:TRZ/ATZ family hydrolase [Halioglobus sp.]